MIDNKPDMQLVGRDDDLERMWAALEAGSVLLVGPRRIGKTVLLKQMCAEPIPQWRAVRLNVEGCTTVEQAVLELEDTLRQASLLSTVKEAVDGVRRVEAGPVAVERSADRDTGTPWQRAEKSIRVAVNTLGPQESLALLMDDVPWWLDSIVNSETAKAARQALGRLRNLRQKDWDGHKVAMVFTGSVGLAGIAESIGASAEINDLQPMELCPLDPLDGALLFELQLVDQSTTWSGDLGEQACRQAGGSPHWIKMLANRMPPGREVGKQDLQDAVESLLSPRMRYLFADEARQHFVRRYGGERAQVCRAILSTAAPSELGAPLEALIAVALTGGLHDRGDAREAVWALVDSFHLEQAGDLFRFTNPLFRLWWLRYGGEA